MLLNGKNMVECHAELCFATQSRFIIDSSQFTGGDRLSNRLKNLQISLTFQLKYAIILKSGMSGKEV